MRTIAKVDTGKAQVWIAENIGIGPRFKVFARSAQHNDTTFQATNNARDAMQSFAETVELMLNIYGWDTSAASHRKAQAERRRREADERRSGNEMQQS